MQLFSFLLIPFFLFGVHSTTISANPEPIETLAPAVRTPLTPTTAPAPLAVEKSSNDAFAQCLTEKGIKVYGSFRCPHCIAQKELFGSSYSRINYVECDVMSKNANVKECTDKNIMSYPTWILSDGEKRVGTQKLEELAQSSGCKLP